MANARRSAREQAQLAAEQAATRRRERRALIAIVAGFVVIVVAIGLGIQAYRTNRAPAATTSSGGSRSASITTGMPLARRRMSCTRAALASAR